MFHFTSKRSGSVYGAIIDIGSGSVGVGVIESNHQSSKPKILYTHREFIRPNTAHTTKEDKMRAMREALFSACLLLSKEGIKALGEHNKRARIQRILVTCASPWAHTTSRTIAHRAEEDLKISNSLIKNLVEDAEEEMVSELEEIAIVGSLGLQIVERATVNVKINGYGVEDPVGLSGKEIELSHITGLVPKEIIEAVHEVQEKIFTDTKLSVHSFMLVNYCVARDVFPDMTEFSLIDVTGETTEIGIVEDDTLAEVVHAPYGSSTLVREITKATQGTPEDTLSKLRSYIEQMEDEDDPSNKEAPAFLKNYEEIVREALESVHKNRQLPQKVLLTTLPQLHELFKMSLIRVFKKVTRETPTLLTYEAGVLNIIAENENKDAFISLAGRFFHKLHGCGEIDRL